MGRFVSRVLILLVAITLPFVVVYFFLIFASSDPSTATLDGDLKEVAADLAQVSKDSQQYGGVVGSLVELHRELLLTTQAMLNQKKLALLRRVSLSYEVSGTPPTPPNQEQMTQIQKEMQVASDEASASDAEAARYSGGLIQSLALVKAATARATMAQLKMSYLFEKYGVPIFGYNADLKSQVPDPTAKNIVTDGAAL